MMDEYITRNNAISAVCFGCNQEFSDEHCEPCECSIRQSIMALPTADVVPKSEAEKLEQEIETLKDSNEHLAVMLMEAKADVASEIFAEIERAREDCIVILGDMGYLQSYKFEQKIAELKKKYKEQHLTLSHKFDTINTV